MKAQVFKLSLSAGTESLFSDSSPVTCAFRVHSSLKVRKERPNTGRKKIQKLICASKPLKGQIISKTVMLVYNKTDFFPYFAQRIHTLPEKLCN